VPRTISVAQKNTQDEGELGFPKLIILALVGNF